MSAHRSSFPAPRFRCPDTPTREFLLFGDRALIDAQLALHPAMKAASRVIHTDVAVSMHDKPSQALRRGRKTSSMWLAIDAVKKGEADVAVSAGNTGALAAMARFCLRMLPGIDRPALAAIWPTARGDSVVLDLGATIGGDAHHLVALAVMGSAMASVLFNLERPTVGLLNIGVEEIKGREEIREAAEMLRAMNLPQLEYIGFVEGDGIGKGAADVIVAEGFSGNIALKAAEGTARQITEFLRAPCRAPGARRSAICSPRTPSGRCATSSTRAKSNGSVVLGLNGIVVKSHGGTDAEGFAYAVDVGYEMVRYDLLTKINQMLNREGSALVGADRAGGCLVTAIRSVVLGCGSYLPQQILTNAELAARIDTSDEWIVQRTGIRQRHIAAEGEFTSHLGDPRRAAPRSPMPGSTRSRST